MFDIALLLSNPGARYRELVTEVPVIEDGRILPPEGPGPGTKLLPGLDRRKDAHVTVSRR